MVLIESTLNRCVALLALVSALACVACASTADTPADPPSGSDASTAAAIEVLQVGPVVSPVPEEVVTSLKLDPFYKKYIAVQGFPIVASEKVSDYALLEAAYLVERMFAHRSDVAPAMTEARVRCAIMAYDELTTHIPEHSDLEPRGYWDRRARGLGATPYRPAVSGAEENLLCFKGDPYSTECILIHEFAHAMHEMGVAYVDETFDPRLQAAYKHAMEAGLWADTYAATNHKEYWAEGVQSWFDTNRENDDLHNEIDTRAELKEYDPDLAVLLTEVYGDTEWRYTKPAQRAEAGHLRGYDSSTAPTFAWPADVMQRWNEYQEQQQRSREGNNEAQTRDGSDMDTTEYLYRIQPTRPALLTEGPTEEEGAIIGEHFAYLKELCDQGVVILAGRTLNTDETSFGIVIFRAESEEAARRIMDEDPAVSNGVMRAELFPYRVALQLQN